LDPLYVYDKETPDYVFENLFLKMASDKDPKIVTFKPETIFPNVTDKVETRAPEMMAEKIRTYRIDKFDNNHNRPAQIQVEMQNEMWGLSSLTSRKVVTPDNVAEWKEDTHRILDDMNEARNAIRRQADRVEERMSLPSRLACLLMIW